MDLNRCLGKYFGCRNMRHLKLHKHETRWDLTPHSRQLLWSQRREQWNINASLGFRMRKGKLDLELPLWGVSTQSTSCKHLLLSSLLAASPSWFCSRNDKAVDTGFISGAFVKCLGRPPFPTVLHTQQSWVQLAKTFRTEPELRVLFCQS